MAAAATRAFTRAASRHLAAPSTSTSSVRMLSTGRVVPQQSDKVHPALVPDPPVSDPRPSGATDPWAVRRAPPPPPSVDDLTSAGYETMEALLESPHPEGRDGEAPETLRKRLVYESRKRGILEMDLILATFARERLAGMDERQLREYDRFLTLPDWSIYYYATGKQEPPAPWAGSWIVGELLQHARNTGKQVRMMPSLPTEDDKVSEQGATTGKL